MEFFRMLPEIMQKKGYICNAGFLKVMLFLNTTLSRKSQIGAVAEVLNEKHEKVGSKLYIFLALLHGPLEARVECHIE